LEVLIVEDDRGLARALARTLEQAGFLCRQVHDGIAALEAIAKATPDLVLIDLLLPKKDGHGVITMLQAAEATRGIPIIAMSGVFKGADSARSTTSAGARAFLEKPFDMKVLVDRVTKLLGNPSAPDAGAPSDALDLAKTPGIEVLWSAMQIRTTGAVHFENGKRKKVVVLDAGCPFAVRSNLAREALGRRLLDSGRIDERVYNESIRRAKATGKRQGEVLIAMGALGEPELRSALASQAEDKLFDVFAWTEGKSWTQTGVRAMSLSSELGGWTPRLTVLRGVSRVSPAVVQKRLEAFMASEVSQDNLHLEDGENADAVGALFQAVSRPVRLRDLIPVHGTTLYALWLIGALDVQASAEREPSSLPGVGSAAATAELERKLVDALKRFEGANHFEVLGISETANDEDVRQAFMNFAKVFHPDKIGRRAPKLIELSGQVFARISEANDALARADVRTAYLGQMRRSRTATADRREVNRILTAEQQFQRAEEALRRRDWNGALEALKWALELDPNEGEFHALRGWTMFLQQQDAGGGEAGVEHIKKGIALSPQSATAYYYLGQVRKACGDPAEAERMFRKTVELRPNHVEAARELRLIQLRKAKGDDTVAGRLFGRKKK
jgi:CheY-like chemotaxis protein/tetratricopeptide (TPR) repeat protein